MALFAGAWVPEPALADLDQLPWVAPDEALPLFLAEGRSELRRISPVLAECEPQLWLLIHTESRHLRRVSAVYSHLVQKLELR